MDVAIIGAAMTDFGRRDGWIRELLSDAGRQCLDNASVPPRTIDHLVVSNMASGEFEGQTGTMNALAADLGIVPAYAERIDQTSASGGAAIQTACRAVESGTSEMVLVVGGEKMTHRETAESADIVASVTHPFEYKHGVTLPAFAGLLARQYLAESDATRASLADVAVKNHRNALANPHAQFRREISRKDVLESPTIADPLRLYDYCPVTDGGAAILCCPTSVASDYTDQFVRVTGIGGATDTHVVHQRGSLSELRAVAESGRQAFSMANVRPADIDVAELHDMATVLEPLQLEALGFASSGAGWKHAVDGETIGADPPAVNPSGGLKARGHPLGATGVSQAVELYRQLRGEAGDRQVEARRGLACNIGGFGNCVTTALFEGGGS